MNKQSASGGLTNSKRGHILIKPKTAEILTRPVNLTIQMGFGRGLADPRKIFYNQKISPRPRTLQKLKNVSLISPRSVINSYTKNFYHKQRTRLKSSF